MLLSFVPFVFGESSGVVTSLGGERKMFGIVSHRLGGWIGHDSTVVLSDWDTVHGRDDEGERGRGFHDKYLM